MSRTSSRTTSKRSGPGGVERRKSPRSGKAAPKKTAKTRASAKAVAALSSRASSKANQKNSKTVSDDTAREALETARAAVSFAAGASGSSSKASSPGTAKRGRTPSTTPKPPVEISGDDACRNCNKDLRHEDKALFVEEEIGRVFCSEECIAGHFAPEIDRLEKEYTRRLSSSDLTGEERENFAHLRWVTLEEPDEIWREKTLSGDHRYTLISEFQPGSRSIWCICICLFLRGEPSFLYLAFPTKNAAMVNQYRRGERVQWSPSRSAKAQARKSSGASEGLSSADTPPRAGPITILNPSEVLSGPTAQTVAAEGGPVMDGLADGWTEDESMRAQVVQERRNDDIPSEEFELYEACLDETLEGPDEVWSIREAGAGAASAAEDSDDEEEEDDSDEDSVSSDGSSEGKDGPEGLRIYHFIRQYRDESPTVWYVIVARETENAEEIEILDAFPTRDPQLVERYRRGTQEIGGEERSASRLVH